MSLLVVIGLAIGLLTSRSSFSRRSLAPLQASIWEGNPRENLAIAAGRGASEPSAPRPRRLVYPYSVVPGGVQDAQDLRRVAARDRVVSAHYADFDYLRARVIRLERAQQMYLSYRIGERIFWTRKRVRLAAGEKLITDGKTLARTRCANQVSEVKHAEVSPEEPPAARFEQPFNLNDGSATQLNMPSFYDSSLLSRTGGPPLSLVGVPGGIAFPPIFPPPIPSSTCETAAQEKQEQQLGIADDEKHEVHCPPSPPGPPPSKPPSTVPEPESIVLLSSGLGAIYLYYRVKLASH